MNKGFTLLELIVVIIILGILATLGFTQYGKTIEKSRTAEAKAILGTIRTAQVGRHLEYGAYTTLANLPVDAPTACDTAHYFTYGTEATAGLSTATRCTTGGKSPDASSACTVTVSIAGAWGGTCP